MRSRDEYVTLLRETDPRKFMGERPLKPARDAVAFVESNVDATNDPLTPEMLDKAAESAPSYGLPLHTS